LKGIILKNCKVNLTIVICVSDFLITYWSTLVHGSKLQNIVSVDRVAKCYPNKMTTIFTNIPQITLSSLMSNNIHYSNAAGLNGIQKQSINYCQYYLIINAISRHVVNIFQPGGRGQNSRNSWLWPSPWHCAHC